MNHKRSLHRVCASIALLMLIACEPSEDKTSNSLGDDRFVQLDDYTRAPLCVVEPSGIFVLIHNETLIELQALEFENTEPTQIVGASWMLASYQTIDTSSGKLVAGTLYPKDGVATNGVFILATQGTKRDVTITVDTVSVPQLIAAPDGTILIVDVVVDNKRIHLWRVSPTSQGPRVEQLPDRHGLGFGVVAVEGRNVLAGYDYISEQQYGWGALVNAEQQLIPLQCAK